jgi:hypothetical protein
MLVSLGADRGQMIVGAGVSRISLYERLDCYDRCRAMAIRKQDDRIEVRPPIWVWLVSNADGRGWLVHPPCRSKANWAITALPDAAALLGTVQVGGVDRSDSPDTTSYMEDVPFMSAPAEAGDPPGQVLICNYSWHEVLGTPHPPWKNEQTSPPNDEDDGTHAAAASSTAKE